MVLTINESTCAKHAGNCNSWPLYKNLHWADTCSLFQLPREIWRHAQEAYVTTMMNLAVFFSYKIYDLKSLSCVQNVQVLFFRDARAVFAINMFNGKVRTNKADSSDVNNSFIFFIQCVCALHIIFGQIERAVKHLGTCGKGTLLRISGDTEDNFSSITWNL